MTKRNSFRQADVERIPRAAAKIGATVQVDIKSLIITVLPSNAKVFKRDDASEKTDPEEFETLADWQAWRDRKRAKESAKSAFDYDPADVPPEPVSPRFNPREYATMEQLVKYGKGVRVHWRTLRGFGPDTRKRLDARGYVGVSYEEASPATMNEVWLTPAGAKAWRAMKEHWEKWPTL